MDDELGDLSFLSGSAMTLSAPESITQVNLQDSETMLKDAAPSHVTISTQRRVSISKTPHGMIRTRVVPSVHVVRGQAAARATSPVTPTFTTSDLSRVTAVGHLVDRSIVRPTVQHRPPTAQSQMSPRANGSPLVSPVRPLFVGTKRAVLVKPHTVVVGRAQNACRVRYSSPRQIRPAVSAPAAAATGVVTVRLVDGCVLPTRSAGAAATRTPAGSSTAGSTAAAARPHAVRVIRPRSALTAANNSRTAAMRTAPTSPVAVGSTVASRTVSTASMAASRGVRPSASPAGSRASAGLPGAVRRPATPDANPLMRAVSAIFEDSPPRTTSVLAAGARTARRTATEAFSAQSPSGEMTRQSMPCLDHLMTSDSAELTAAHVVVSTTDVAGGSSPVAQDGNLLGLIQFSGEPGADDAAGAEVQADDVVGVPLSPAELTETVSTSTSVGVSLATDSLPASPVSVVTTSGTFSSLENTTSGTFSPLESTTCSVSAVPTSGTFSSLENTTCPVSAVTTSGTFTSLEMTTASGALLESLLQESVFTEVPDSVIEAAASSPPPLDVHARSADTVDVSVNGDVDLFPGVNAVVNAPDVVAGEEVVAAVPNCESSPAEFVTLPPLTSGETNYKVSATMEAKAIKGSERHSDRRREVSSPAPVSSNCDKLNHSISAAVRIEKAHDFPQKATKTISPASKNVKTVRHPAANAATNQLVMRPPAPPSSEPAAPPSSEPPDDASGQEDVLSAVARIMRLTEEPAPVIGDFRQLAEMVEKLRRNPAISWDRHATGRLPVAAAASLCRNAVKPPHVFVNQLGLLSVGRHPPANLLRADNSSACRICGSHGNRASSVSDGKYCDKACEQMALKRSSTKRKNGENPPPSKRARLECDDRLDSQAVVGRNGHIPSGSTFSWSGYLSALRPWVPEATAWSGRDDSSSTSSNSSAAAAADASCSTVSQQFAVGSRLEAVDPRCPHNICEVRVTDVLGNLVRLKICDNEFGAHEFWTSADSALIYPCGFTQRHWSANTRLRPFSAPNDSLSTSSPPAPAACFSGLVDPPPATGLLQLDLHVGHMLELAEPRCPRHMLPARVLAVRGGMVLVRPDEGGTATSSTDEQLQLETTGAGGVWLGLDSPRLRPAGWGRQHRLPVVLPKGGGGAFNWERYLVRTRSLLAPGRVLRATNAVHCTGTLVPGLRLELMPDADRPRHVHVAHVAETCRHGLVRVAREGVGAEDTWLPADSWQLQAPGWSRALGLPLVVPDDRIGVVGGSASEGALNPRLLPLTALTPADIRGKNLRCPPLESPEAAAGVHDPSGGLKSLKSVDAFLRSHPDVHRWSCQTVGSFVQSFGGKTIGAVSSTFVHQEIDGESLLSLEKSDIMDQLQAPKGLAVKVYAYIQYLRSRFKYHTNSGRQDSEAHS